MEPSDDTWNIASKGGNMYLNRFCIDEDATFESSGVYNLQKYTVNGHPMSCDIDDDVKKAKGKVMILRDKAGFVNHRILLILLKRKL